jgi:vitamin B12 transporter
MNLIYQIVRHGAAVCLTFAMANTFAADADKNTENLTVTANRTPTPLSQAGSAVSVVDRDSLINRQSVFASDALKDVPGVMVSRGGSFGSQTQVRIRGAEANQVLVFIDGVKATDPAAGDEFTFEQLGAYDIERIEVVRGPQSALWGSDAVAGVINVVTRRTESGQNAEGFLEGGSFGTVHGGARTGKRWDNTSLDFSASYYDTDGENIAREGGEEDGFDNTTITLTAQNSPRDNIKLGFFGRYSDSTSEFDNISPVTGLPEDADLESDVGLGYLRANGNITVLDGRWDHGLRLTWNGSDRDNFDSGSATSTQEGDRYGAYYQSTFGWGDMIDDLSPNQLIFAVDYEKEEFTQHDPLYSANNQDEDRDSIGYVSQYVTQLSDALDVSGSVRYDDNSDFDNVTTWRLTGSYTFDTWATRLHTSAGTGQKAPTFIELFGFFPDAFAFRGNPDLDPEKSTGWDFGIEQKFLNNRITADVTYFNSKLEDEITTIFDFDAGTGEFFSMPANLDGDSRRKGVETSISGSLTDSLSTTVSYTYTDTRQPDPAGGSVREVRRPRNVAGANLNYVFIGGRANLNLNATYTGEQTDSFFDPNTFVSENVDLDDYWVANLAGRYSLTKKITLQARVENLFDEDYEDVYGFSTPGIGAYAGIRMAFGN